MSKRKGNAASVDFILGLVFSIIGSVFVIVAVCFAVFQVQFEKGAEETNAVITRIESYRDGQGDSHTMSVFLMKQTDRPMRRYWNLTSAAGMKEKTLKSW